jgi:hypothetical protein
MGAGAFTFPNSIWPKLRWERAWCCAACKVSWYDGGYRCFRCGEAGEPEALPEGAQICETEQSR